MVQFLRKGNIYIVTRHSSLMEHNILGISFADKPSDDPIIEVVEWNFPKSDFTKSTEKRLAKSKWSKWKKKSGGTSKEEVLKQVLSGLKSFNERLGTNYQVSKLYYNPLEESKFYAVPNSEPELVYRTMFRDLLSHYHNGNEFEEAKGSYSDREGSRQSYHINDWKEWYTINDFVKIAFDNDLYIVNEIAVGDAMYSLKNIPGDTTLELSIQLATQIYQSIRECDTDISAIARNLAFKPENVKKLKDHVFINQHYLDSDKPSESKYERLDPDLQQALAWKRLEVGTHIPEDITWVKHECAEQFIESLYNCTYSEAHEIAQKHFNGTPWNDNCEKYM